MLITPEYVFEDVTHITPEWLAAKGITALVLDIDNTLTADRHRRKPAHPQGRKFICPRRHGGVYCKRHRPQVPAYTSLIHTKENLHG